MLKNYFSSCIIAMLVLCMFNCTNKEINLITNIDFELLTDHEASGFVKDSLITGITLVPERTNYPGFEYYVNYKVTKGNGYFVSEDGSVMPEESDISIHFENDFTANWHYVGTEPGSHTITIEAKDNFERTKTAQLTYEVQEIDLVWEVSSPQKMAQVNDTIPLQLSLINNSGELTLDFIYNITIAEGAGLVLGADKKPIEINKGAEIKEGAYELFYVGAGIGKNIVRFDLETSNDIKRDTTIDFDIKEELINEAPTANPDVAETPTTMEVEIDVVLNDEDPEDDTLTITSVDKPINGKASIVDGKILYTPDATLIGKEVFEYTITDISGNEAVGVVTVTVKERETIDIPDDNFEAALITLGHDEAPGDNKMFKDVAEQITNLDVSNKSIANLIGIEGFATLETLRANDNTISTIDLSQNTKLKTLWLKDNNITSIDLSSNALLETLTLTGNPISSIDLSKNVALKGLGLARMPLTKVNLTANIQLTELWVAETQITTIDVTTLVNLTTLNLYKNSLSAVDLSNNVKLTGIRLENNQLSDLNLKGLTRLTSLNVTNNTDLDCVQVDNQTEANTQADWQKDTVTYYSEDCSQPRETIDIPDNNFEQALFDLGYDDVVGDNKIYKDVAESVTFLDVSDKSIADLTGIEGFVNLEELIAQKNGLTKINTSTLEKLITLDVWFNQITSVDLSKNLALEVTDLRYNPISVIDIKSNVLLKNFLIGTWENSVPTDAVTISTINVSMLKDLEWLHVGGTRITTLDVSNNPKLTFLQCGSTQITSLNLRNNPELDYLFAGWNYEMTSLDISQNFKLTSLNPGGTPLGSIDVSHLADLETLALWNMGLSNLDVTKNTKLEFLAFGANNITQIDVSNNDLLEELAFQKNNLESLDISTLDISKLILKGEENPNLDCIQVNSIDIANSRTDWTKDAHTSFSLNCN